MSTKAKHITIEIKQANLPPGVDYRWIYPYLIVPLQSDMAHIQNAIRDFEERNHLSVAIRPPKKESPPRATNTK